MLQRTRRVASVFDACYVINLDRRPDRWAHVSRQLQRARVEACLSPGARVTRVPAVDGATLDVAALHAAGVLSDDGYARWQLPLSQKLFGMDLTTGAIGCALSHRSVWQRIVAAQHRAALVLEDDVEFHHRFARLLPACWSRVPRDWGVVYLGGLDLLAAGKPPRPFVATGVRRAYHGHRELTAYVLHAASAARCLALSTPLTWQVDTHVCSHVEHDAAVARDAYIADPVSYVFQPALAIQVTSLGTDVQKRAADEPALEDAARRVREFVAGGTSDDQTDKLRARAPRRVHGSLGSVGTLAPSALAYTTPSPATSSRSNSVHYTDADKAVVTAVSPSSSSMQPLTRTVDDNDGDDARGTTSTTHVGNNSSSSSQRRHVIDDEHAHRGSTSGASVQGSALAHATTLGGDAYAALLLPREKYVATGTVSATAHDADGDGDAAATIGDGVDALRDEVVHLLQRHSEQLAAITSASAAAAAATAATAAAAVATRTAANEGKGSVVMSPVQAAAHAQPSQPHMTHVAHVPATSTPMPPYGVLDDRITPQTLRLLLSQQQQQQQRHRALPRRCTSLSPTDTTRVARATAAAADAASTYMTRRTDSVSPSSMTMTTQRQSLLRERRTRATAAAASTSMLPGQRMRVGGQRARDFVVATAAASSSSPLPSSRAVAATAAVQRARARQRRSDAHAIVCHRIDDDDVSSFHSSRRRVSSPTCGDGVVTAMALHEPAALTLAHAAHHHHHHCDSKRTRDVDDAHAQTPRSRGGGDGDASHTARSSAPPALSPCAHRTLCHDDDDDDDSNSNDHTERRVDSAQRRRQQQAREQQRRLSDNGVATSHTQPQPPLSLPPCGHAAKMAAAAATTTRQQSHRAVTQHGRDEAVAAVHDSVVGVTRGDDSALIARLVRRCLAARQQQQQQQSLRDANGNVVGVAAQPLTAAALKRKQQQQQQHNNNDDDNDAVDAVTPLPFSAVDAVLCVSREYEQLLRTHDASHRTCAAAALPCVDSAACAAARHAVVRRLTSFSTTRIPEQYWTRLCASTQTSQQQHQQQQLTRTADTTTNSPRVDVTPSSASSSSTTAVSAASRRPQIAPQELDDDVDVDVDDASANGRRHTRAAAAASSSTRAVLFPAPRPTARSQVYLLAQALDDMLGSQPQWLRTLADATMARRILPHTPSRTRRGDGDNSDDDDDNDDDRDHDDSSDDDSHLLAPDVQAASTAAHVAYTTAASHVLDIVDAGLVELVRQVSCHCVERGALLDVLRQTLVDVAHSHIRVLTHVKQRAFAEARRRRRLAARVRDMRDRVAAVQSRERALALQVQAVTQMCDVYAHKAAELDALAARAHVRRRAAAAAHEHDTHTSLLREYERAMADAASDALGALYDEQLSRVTEQQQQQQLQQQQQQHESQQADAHEGDAGQRTNVTTTTMRVAGAPSAAAARRRVAEQSDAASQMYTQSHQLLCALHDIVDAANAACAPLYDGVVLREVSATARVAAARWAHVARLVGAFERDKRHRQRVFTVFTRWCAQYNQQQLQRQQQHDGDNDTAAAADNNNDNNSSRRSDQDAARRATQPPRRVDGGAYLLRTPPEESGHLSQLLNDSAASCMVDARNDDNNDAATADATDAAVRARRRDTHAARAAQYISDADLAAMGVDDCTSAEVNAMFVRDFDFRAYLHPTWPPAADDNDHNDSSNGTYSLTLPDVCTMLGDVQAVLREVVLRLRALAQSPIMQRGCTPPLQPPSHPDEACALCGRCSDHDAAATRRRQASMEYVASEVQRQMTALSDKCQKAESERQAARARARALRGDLDRARAEVDALKQQLRTLTVTAGPQQQHLLRGSRLAMTTGSSGAMASRAFAGRPLAVLPRRSSDSVRDDASAGGGGEAQRRRRRLAAGARDDGRTAATASSSSSSSSSVAATRTPSSTRAVDEMLLSVASAADDASTAPRSSVTQMFAPDEATGSSSSSGSSSDHVAAAFASSARAHGDGGDDDTTRDTKDDSTQATT